jgi:Fe-S-cluster-containing dehydrogenase component
MKKCTLCVDKIYNENLPVDARVPACVSACPAGARSFGDLGDPESDVSLLVRARGGYDLMPEQGCRPVNKYLPPKERLDGAGSGPAALDPVSDTDAGILARWVDRILSR